VASSMASASPRPIRDVFIVRYLLQMLEGK
jgi:hypothetical protein